VVLWGFLDPAVAMPIKRADGLRKLTLTQPRREGNAGLATRRTKRAQMEMVDVKQIFRSWRLAHGGPPMHPANALHALW